MNQSVEKEKHSKLDFYYLNNSIEFLRKERIANIKYQRAL